MDIGILGAINLWAQFLAGLFVVICIALIIIVLLQKGRGGGLSAAFGGAGGQSAFGSKTGDMFTWATILVVGVFLILAMVLTVNYKPYVELEEAAPMVGSPEGAVPAQPQSTPPAENAAATEQLPATTNDGMETPTPENAGDAGENGIQPGAESEEVE